MRILTSKIVALNCLLFLFTASLPINRITNICGLISKFKMGRFWKLFFGLCSPSIVNEPTGD